MYQEGIAVFFFPSTEVVVKSVTLGKLYDLGQVA